MYARGTPWKINNGKSLFNDEPILDIDINLKFLWFFKLTKAKSIIFKTILTSSSTDEISGEKLEVQISDSL